MWSPMRPDRGHADARAARTPWTARIPPGVLNITAIEQMPSPFSSSIRCHGLPAERLDELEVQVADLVSAQRTLLKSAGLPFQGRSRA